MPTLTTKQDLDFLYPLTLGRAHHGTEGYDVYLNKDYRFVITDLYNSAAGKAHRKADAAQVKTIGDLTAKVNTLQREVNDADDYSAKLTGELNNKTGRINELSAALDNLQNANDQLKAAQPTSDDTVQLNALSAAVQWLLTRLGIKK